MNGSLLSPAERRALKAAFRQLVALCGGPHEAAESCRVSASVLSRYGSENDEHEGSFPPVDVVKELELVAGEPLVSRLLADQGGFDLVARVAPQASADFAGHDSDLTRASCDLLVRFREAMADGSLCAGDLAGLDAVSSTLQRELAEFRRDAGRHLATVTPIGGRR